MEEQKVNEEVVLEIQNLIASMSSLIESSDIMKEINFAIFFKDGKLSYVDLDIMDKTIKSVKEEKEQN